MDTRVREAFVCSSACQWNNKSTKTWPWPGRRTLSYRCIGSLSGCLSGRWILIHLICLLSLDIKDGGKENDKWPLHTPPSGYVRNVVPGVHLPWKQLSLSYCCIIIWERGECAGHTGDTGHVMGFEGGRAAPFTSMLFTQQLEPPPSRLKTTGTDD